MDSRVLPVSKQLGASNPKSTRPITILPLIYRIWSRVLARKLLDAWRQTLTNQITGFVPGRNAMDFVYAMQLQIEATNHGHSNQQWGGLTLDLVKCFNTLPQAPLQHLLVRLGVPEPLVIQWMHSLQRMTRHWQISGQLFPTTIATTGVPEGDSLSVTAMMAVNQFWTALTQHPSIRLHAYADNWSYSAKDPELHSPTVQSLIRITQAMALVIDWDKTWGWSTDNAHKLALHRAAQELLPANTSLQQVGSARELGYILSLPTEAIPRDATGQTCQSLATTPQDATNGLLPGRQVPCYYLRSPFYCTVWHSYVPVWGAIFHTAQIGHRTSHDR